MKIFTRIIVGGCIAIMAYSIVGTVVLAVREINRAKQTLKDIDVEFEKNKMERAYDAAKSCEITPIFKGES